MTRSLRTVVTLGGTTLALVGVAVVGFAGAANAAEPTASSTSSTSSSASTATVRADVRAVMHALPTSLRKDVHAAMHHRTRAERHDALVAIEQKVVAGDYGTTAKTIATDVQSDWSSLPKGVTHRAEVLVSGRRGDHVREFRTMLRRALAGKDGTTLQQQLESLASSLPAVPAPTAKPSATPGS